MRGVSPRWPITISTSHQVTAEVTAWYDGVQTATVPILDGTVTFDASAKQHRRLTLTIPARTIDEHGGITDWVPGDDPAHPLAAYGQRLHVKAGIVHADGTAELVEIGWFLIESWSDADDAGTITLEAADLRRLVDDARLYRAESPPSGSTYYGELKRLLAGIVPVAPLPGTVTDRTIMASRIWDRERGESVDKLVQAWPAQWRVNDAGQAAITPVPPAGHFRASDAVVSFVDGINGTTISRGRSAQRGKVNNAIVAAGKAPQGDDERPQPFAAAEVTDPQSPIRVDGPYGRVPRFYASDLIADDHQAKDVAAALLARYSTTGRTDHVSAVPNAAVELDDIAAVRVGAQSFVGRITAITLPLGISGPMELDISTEPDDDEPDEKKGP